MRNALIILAAVSLGGCTTSAIGGKSLEAACDTWWSAILTTERGDPRKFRENELLHRESHAVTCQ